VLSDQSRQGLTSAFERAARTTIVRSQDDACQILAEPADGTTAFSADPLLVITISSFAFRLLALFQVADNDANRAYFLAAGAGCTLQEGFAEVANLCCGALSREISSAFPHLAMSTPCSLGPQCMHSLAQLKPEYTSRHTVAINSGVQVNVTLCMCCSAAVDIPTTLAQEQTAASGELEIF
jgi:hypothetical protein